MNAVPLLSVTASVVPSSRARLYPLMLIEGRGTAEHPRILTFLLRHADYADETATWEVTQQTYEVAQTLRNALLAVSTNASSEPELEGRLREVLVLGNPVATKTGTYYSVLVSLIIGARIAVAGIGESSMSLWHGGDLDTVLPPSTQRIGTSARVLTAGLGLGFDPRHVRSSVLDLNTHGAGLFVVGTDSSFEEQLVRGQDRRVEQIYEHRLRHAAAGDTAAVFALIRNISDDPR